MTGEVIAEVPQSTAHDVTVAVAAARAAQRSWARTPMAHRKRIMLRLHDLVFAHQDQLLDLVQLESGKARAHGFEEVVDVALVARHYARRAAAYLAPRRSAGILPVLTNAVTRHHPVGVVGVVTPWNYPLTLPVSDSIPALLAGQRGRAAPRPADGFDGALRQPAARRGRPARVRAAGRRRRRSDRRAGGRRAGRLRLLHRLDRHRPAGRADSGRAPRWGVARARRQEQPVRAGRRRP